MHGKATQFNALYQNVRGLKTKLSGWRNNLAVLEHNVVAVTETFLDNSVEDSELVCGDWSILRRDRCSPCGGVALAARAPIVLRRRRDLETDSGEDLWACFHWHGTPIYVCVVYIKPSAKDSDYMQFFCKIESFCNNLKAPIIILGDLNLYSASLNINNYYCYFQSFCSLSEKNVVRNVYGGMLDVVLIQESDIFPEYTCVSETDGIVSPDAYHPPLTIEVRMRTSFHADLLEPSNINPCGDWNFKQCDFNQLFSLLSESAWDTVFQAKDVSSAAGNLYRVIYDIFDLCIPKKRRNNIRSRRFPVWFTYDIIRDIKRKSRLHTSWKRTKCRVAFESFSRVRSDLKSRTALAYSSYMESIEGNIQKNPREFWRHVSSLRVRGGFEPSVTYKGETLSGTCAAEAFANFFASVFLTDVPVLNAETAYLSDRSFDSNYISITRITPEDVMFGINKLKPSSSTGPDGIPSTILKQAKKDLCYPLCYIFNLALETGVYPPQWKLSRVSPIPKGSNRSEVEEHRPVAILSSPAKVFEGVIHKYVLAQVDKYLTNAQHGFRPKRSVDTNLLTLVEYISTRLDRGSQVDVLYFDFRKAFDRVNNDILLTKLSNIGFAPRLLRLLADYLRDRQQFVRLGIYESRPYHTRSGVNQGSILGPLLFLLMVNDLPAVLEQARCLLYADDLKLFLEVRSNDDCVALQRDVDAVCEWSVANGMEFNMAKCGVMTFGRIRHPIFYDYNLNGSCMSRFSTTTDLGVTFDRGLTFHDHMVALSKESFRRLGFVLRNVCDFRNHHVLRLIYAALVRCKLESSMCVWNPHETTYILLLEKVQKAFLRYLYKRIYGYYPFMYPTKFLLGCLGYNSLEVRRETHQIVNMCKIVRGLIDAPALHNELCRLYVPTKFHRSRKHKLFAVPMCRTVARARSPVPRSLAALNALLDSSPNCDLFADGWKEILIECLWFCEKMHLC